MTLRRTLLALLSTGLLAATTLAAAPAQAAWTPTERWHGAVTQACKVGLANGKVRVKVRVNNTNGTDRAAAGLNRVRADGQPARAWTYTRTVARGAVSSPVSLDFEPGSRVWLLVGSNVGITGERAYALRSLDRC
ncbi:hypothetical protein GCM10023350_21590 [Nocardioides endophyticus]|uniref:Secreted protein n=1 Tax=Nocardioides endophyticus TaxID=1353775 RepID=A0ABP8YQX5_9ACTN